MALDHAGWDPSSQADLEATGVCLGSGIGNLDEMYSTSVTFDKDVSLASWTSPRPGKKKLRL
jgi:3-oxoacyl-[acyl-carrier-protein] synthase II